MGSKPRKTLIVISTILIVALILGFGIYFTLTSTLFSAVGELGWIPFTENTEGLTNRTESSYCNCDRRYNCNPACTRAGDPASYITGSPYTLSTEFWRMEKADWGNMGASLTGSDAQPIFSASSWFPYTIYFNKDLNKRYFAVDYSLENVCEGTGDGFSFVDVSFSVLGYSISQRSGITPTCPATGVIGTGRIELRPSIIEEGKSTLYVNGQRIQDITLTQPYYLPIYLGAGKLTLSNPRYKPTFDCKVDNDEVLIFDEYANATTFSINDMTYPVKKFCINQPAIIRSMTDRGIATDTDGEILIRLSEGGSITVKSDQTIRVPYITTVQTGLLRCPTSEAYNTKTKVCENILSEGLPDEKGTFITTLDVGENQISFVQNSVSKQSISVGDVVFSPSVQKYDKTVCGCAIGRTSPPNPYKDCWYVESGTNKITSGSTFNLNDYISIEYTATGSGVFNGIKTRNGQDVSFNCEYTDATDWTNLYKVIIDKEALKIINGSTEENVELNTTGNFKITLDNKLGNFENSGFKIRIIENMIDRITDEEVPMALSKGVKEYNLPVKQKTLGDMDIEAIPYIVVEGKKIYGSSKVIFRYTATGDKEAFDELNKTLADTIADKKKQGWILYSIIAILALAIVSLGIIMARTLKRK